MRRASIIAAVLGAVLATAAPAWAQYVAPGVKAPPVLIRPPVIIIKPSQALRIAMSVAPSAKALGVQLRGPLYVVKLKQGNKVIKVMVNAGTGAIQ